MKSLEGDKRHKRLRKRLKGSSKKNWIEWYFCDRWKLWEGTLQIPANHSQPQMGDNECMWD